MPSRTRLAHQAVDRLAEESSLLRWRLSQRGTELDQVKARLDELEAAVRDLLAAEGCCTDCDGSGDRPAFDRLHQLIHGEVGS